MKQTEGWSAICLETLFGYYFFISFMIILLNTVKKIGHGIFKITNRAVKLILLRRISFAIHQHNPKEEKHSSTARQLFRPRLISSVTRNNWRENANPDSLLKDGYLSLDDTKSR